MIHPKTTAMLFGAGLLIFVAAVAWPTSALFISAFVLPNGESTELIPSGRQGLLLFRSLWMAAAAAVTTLLFSIPAAAMIGICRSGKTPILLAAVMMTLLVCPPMVYVFGWQRILPASTNPSLQCILIWSLWAWPIPAMLVGLSWVRSVHPAFEAALLETSSVSAWRRVALPALRKPLFASVLVLFVLFVGDYGTPHACGLVVWATELLALSSVASEPIQVLIPALPVSILCLICTALLVVLCHKGTLGTELAATTGRTTTSHAHLLITIAICAVSWVIPLIGLVSHLRGAPEFVATWRTYWPDILATLGTAGLAAILSTLVGMAACLFRRGRLIVVGWMVLFAAVPASLVGVAMIYGYNHSATTWVYDSVAIVVLAYVAKFGWISVVAARVAMSRIDPGILEQASLDGASKSATLRHIVQPAIWPTLVCGAWVFITLAISDVAATSLVRVPSFTPIAHILIEKFHRLEDQMLISLSLTLMTIAVIPALFLCLAIRRSSTRG
ncbi:MAG: ABC transporter permease subunit [Planctomycetota bacterium]